ncbi:MAG: DUF488 domain-containing protein [Hyphomicrobiaceae bacterium]
MTKAAHISATRVYDEPGVPQRARLLVDALWPRGIGKADLALDDWIREVAPSRNLRKWFGHDPDKWDEFRRRYRAELDDNEEAVERCLAWCRKGPVVLLYGAKDRDHNQAVALQDYLRERLAREDPT